MKTVAIVPARGGSKGLPRKNLRRIAGHSLVGWAVRAGLEAELVDEVVVSSEDMEILAEAVRCGARPLVRPDELATDEASTDSVLYHAMNVLGWKHDLVVLLQPTVPFRAPGLVDKAIRRLEESGADSLFTANRLHFIWRRLPNHAGTKGTGPWVQSNCKGERPTRQEFSDVDFRWHEDGAVFVSRATLLARTKARLGGVIEIMETPRTLDIDTEEDLRIAEAFLTACGGFV